MADPARKRDVAVSMRFREDDLAIIDRGAEARGISRTEFFRQVALREAQLAILTETVIRLSPEAFDDFVAALERPVQREPPPKMREVLSRKAPWERR
jgi:uncharacterized protein (DUF1778 family)